jgi:hypothetical protein
MKAYMFGTFWAKACAPMLTYPLGTLRFGARHSLPTALKHEGFEYFEYKESVYGLK